MEVGSVQWRRWVRQEDQRLDDRDAVVRQRLADRRQEATRTSRVAARKRGFGGNGVSAELSEKEAAQQARTRALNMETSVQALPPRLQQQARARAGYPTGLPVGFGRGGAVSGGGVSGGGGGGGGVGGGVGGGSGGAAAAAQRRPWRINAASPSKQTHTAPHASDTFALTQPQGTGGSCSASTATAASAVLRPASARAAATRGPPRPSSAPSLRQPPPPRRVARTPDAPEGRCSQRSAPDHPLVAQVREGYMISAEQMATLHRIASLTSRGGHSARVAAELAAKVGDGHVLDDGELAALSDLVHRHGREEGGHWCSRRSRHVERLNCSGAGGASGGGGGSCAAGLGGGSGVVGGGGVGGGAKASLDAIPYRVWRRLPYEKRMAFLSLMTSPPLYDRVCDILEEGRNLPPPPTHHRQQAAAEAADGAAAPARLADPGLSASAPFPLGEGGDARGERGRGAQQRLATSASVPGLAPPQC